MKYFSLSSWPVWLMFGYRYLPPLHSYFSVKICEVLSPTPFPVNFRRGGQGGEQENLFSLKPPLCATQFRSTNVGSVLCSWLECRGGEEGAECRGAGGCSGSPEAQRPCCPLASYVPPDLGLEMQLPGQCPRTVCVVCAIPSQHGWEIARPWGGKDDLSSFFGRRKSNNFFWWAVSVSQ